MQVFKIESEDPSIHWPDIKIQGKNVLDLGCGRWEETDASKMTPVFFINNGAKSVIGVDSSLEEIKYFRSLNLPNCYFYAENIKSSYILKTIIKQNEINAIKCDIEGREIFFLDFSKEDLTTVTSMYIEYHGHTIRNQLVLKLQELGFKIVKDGHLWIDGFGVLFCEK